MSWSMGALPARQAAWNFLLIPMCNRPILAAAWIAMERKSRRREERDAASGPNLPRLHRRDACVYVRLRDSHGTCPRQLLETGAARSALCGVAWDRRPSADLRIVQWRHHLDYGLHRRPVLHSACRA